MILLPRSSRHVPTLTGDRIASQLSGGRLPTLLCLLFWVTNSPTSPGSAPARVSTESSAAANARSSPTSGILRVRPDFSSFSAPQTSSYGRYRTGSLAAHGLSPDGAGLGRIRDSSWQTRYRRSVPTGLARSGRRGVDSLVQTCSGVDVSEAEHFGAGEPAKPMPRHALDYGVGYS
ncbi:hypothetical protein CTA1_11823 [Colletotrichum tanaceti]|uniref:Uncharacterized protein n=1 Tax=Colletotrichum tanaceti TaxID=1306861 RepID=A0A4U6X787_9PEZI|nr:hypothetical protein CTA1_11823 [Colletotrichum tanaceti]